MKRPIWILPQLAFIIMAWAFISCQCNSTKEITEINLEWPASTNTLFSHQPGPPEPPVIQDPEPIPAIVGYRYKIEKKFTLIRYATCYEQNDGPIERKGIYANDDMRDLHRSERRLTWGHFTVALAPEDDSYHRALIELPGGIVTHKWRVHVPDYNKEAFPTLTSRDAYLPEGERYKAYFDSSYWSVPRDRHKWKGRIDVLFTDADVYYDIDQRQKYWARKNTHEWPCEFWEIEKWAVYSDGTERKAE